jgi:hypothetical protein
MLKTLCKRLEKRNANFIFIDEKRRVRRPAVTLQNDQGFGIGIRNFLQHET